MSRKICVVTGTRAEFGLLRWLMGEIQSSLEVELQVVATGMHLSPEFGFTYREIEEAGFTISAKVEMLLSADTAISVTKSMGLGLIGYADAYARLAPDLIVVLGDRFEIFAATAAALIAGIPVAHLHGGETTEGAIDEALRHSITKMSHLHFVAADDYRRRVIQLGEQPERVFLVGGLGVDAIRKLRLLNRNELEKSLGFTFGERNLLVTFHPVTLDSKTTSEEQLRNLLEALKELTNTKIIFTMPNADTGGRNLSEMISNFVNNSQNCCAFASLGQLRYLSCMRFVDGVVGNSSSGLLEAPSMKVGSVNIGDRQKGRLCADSVINCSTDKISIRNALHTLFEPNFKKKVSSSLSPYGDGGASSKIFHIIKSFSLDGLTRKSFKDFSVA